MNQIEDNNATETPVQEVETACEAPVTVQAPCIALEEVGTSDTKKAEEASITDGMSGIFGRLELHDAEGSAVRLAVRMAKLAPPSDTDAHPTLRCELFLAPIVVETDSELETDDASGFHLYMQSMPLGPSQYVPVPCDSCDVVARDIPVDGVHHEYLVSERIGDPDVKVRQSVTPVFFQKGPLKEVGPNGPSDEAYLVILRHRLEGFQSGPYACDHNAKMLAGINMALEAIAERKAEREARGVEGLNKV